MSELTREEEIELLRKLIAAYGFVMPTDKEEK